MAADGTHSTVVLLLNFIATFGQTVFKCRHKRQALAVRRHFERHQTFTNKNEI